MLDIGGSELLVVAVVALLVVGPKELPAMLRTIGRFVGMIKTQAQEFRAQFDEAIRDTELHDLKTSVDELKSEARAGLDDLTRGLDKEMEDVKDVGHNLSREIEDSTKQDHDLDWLDEYERKVELGDRSGEDASATGAGSDETVVGQDTRNARPGDAELPASGREHEPASHVETSSAPRAASLSPDDDDATTRSPPTSSTAGAAS